MYVAGWDGGGSKTRLVMLDENGREIGSALSGPINPNGTDEAVVKETVQSGLAGMEARFGLGTCAALVIGMAGISNVHAARLVEETVRACGYTGLLALKGDQEISLAGALEGHGAVLISGTGSVLFGRDREGRTFRVGGYGYLIDDPGSGYAIGRDILTAVARAHDGRGPETLLTDAVREKLGTGDIGGMISWLYADGTGKKEIASLSRLLLPAWEAGDRAAEQIAHRAGTDLAEMVLAGWRKTGMEDGELAFSGSILEHYAPVREAVERAVRAVYPGIRMGFPKKDAAFGAARLALEMAMSEKKDRS